MAIYQIHCLNYETKERSIIGQFEFTPTGDIRKDIYREMEIVQRIAKPLFPDLYVNEFDAGLVFVKRYTKKENDEIDIRYVAALHAEEKKE